MKRKGIKPSLKFGIDLPRGSNGNTDAHIFRRVLPFRRSALAIAVIAVMLTVFTLPAVFTFNQALVEWGRFESLFDLVAALFLSAWLLGWVSAPLIMAVVLILMLFGREVLKAGPGYVEIFLGLPFVGVTARYDVTKMRNLRFERPLKKSSKSWRGSHCLFDYGANTIAVGSDIDGDEMATLRSQLQMASGAKIRRGDARPEEILTQWDPGQKAPVEASLAQPMLNNAPLSLASPSTLLLIIANLVPVAGSVFFAWNLNDVMVLYWAESAVIGFFNICKIVVIGRWTAVLAGTFFVAHFGAFMSIHFLFIYTIFIEQKQTGDAAGGDLAEVAQLFSNLWPALAALFISHTFSFYRNFLGRHEYRGRTLNAQMSEPYNRIIFMHLAIIFGGGLSLALGGPAPILFIVIALKIVFDVKAHLKQHPGA